LSKQTYFIPNQSTEIQKIFPAPVCGFTQKFFNGFYANNPKLFREGFIKLMYFLSKNSFDYSAILDRNDFKLSEWNLNFNNDTLFSIV